MALTSVDEILDFAIKNEIGAAEFYMGLAGKVDKPWMKKTFEDFAAEERGHQAKLEKVKQGGELTPAAGKIQDLKIGDYLVEPEADKDLDYQGALILAMKAEKAAFRLYSDMAASTDDASLKSTLLALAQEEAKHKLRFEVEYDENFLTEN
jgi:rubrerythrin